MKKRNMIGLAIISLALLFAAITPIGCASADKLETGGSYAPTTNIVAGGVTNAVPLSAPDIGLYIADEIYKTTRQAITFVFDLERDNRAFFWSIDHGIKNSLDKLRPQASELNRTWAVARQAYTANPTPAGLDRVNSVLGQLQRLAVMVQVSMPKKYQPK